MAKKKVGKKGKTDSQDDSKFTTQSTSPVPESQIEDSEQTNEPSSTSAFDLLDEDEGGLMNMISKSVKKKGKKAKAIKDNFSDDEVDSKFGVSALANLGSDGEEDVFGQIVSKKKGKKDKKGAVSFETLGLELDISDSEIPLPSKKSKKKKSKEDLPAFDELDNEDIAGAIEEGDGLDLNSTPKSKNKKSKKPKEMPAFDEPFEEEAEAEVISAPSSSKKGKKNKNEDDLDALAALIEDDSIPAPSTSASKSKKGKKKKNDNDLDALAALIEDSTVVPAVASKNKKNKNKKKSLADDNDEPDVLTEEISAASPKESSLTPEGEPEIKIKSAKQKEKERKERQKEEKKRQAALQKAQEDSTADAAQPSKTEIETTKGKGKKGKAPSAAILALRKQQEAMRAAEEEANRLLEEEKKRIEEEERRLAEEERTKELARQEKKQRELEKREQLRKEGKLLTKAQKEAKRKQELRLQALVASGMKIAAFESKSEDSAQADAPKRVVYSDKKKKGKGFNAKNVSEPATPPPSAVISKPDPVTVEAFKTEEVKESWEDSGEEKPDEDDVKDNWEDSEEEAETKETEQSISFPKEVDAKAPEAAHEESSEDGSSEDSVDSDDSDDSDDSESEEELTHAQKQAHLKKQEAAERRKKRIEAAMAARSKDELRSPICCILGHVDTGKTKLLDKIRQTNVQEGEAGGITQQIGATYFPVENIIQKTAILGNKGDEYNLPGLLVIDTPGHESFTNLRTRGSSLCNIAILVVDLMHGLEPQTLESIRLLRDRKTPFIVALNKIDRIYDWKATPDNGFLDSLSKQPKYVKDEFDTRVAATITAFAEQGLNAKLYYENKNFAKYVSFVPTSAITGEGIPDLLHLLVTLTQSRLTDRLMYVSELECTVLEVKVIEGLGTTIDVVLSNGYLNEGDRIVVCGLNGPIVTQVRALLTPQPLRELRIKSAYVHHKRVKAALGIKISAPDLEKAIAGSRLLVVGPDDDEEELKDAVMEDLQTLLSSIDKSGRGVSVQASTLGSLEALLEFLRVSKIPVSAINIGPVHKKDIIRASAMLEKAKEFAVMLAFDVEVDKEAGQLADQLGVRIFTADIIYHLFDQFTAYNKDIMEQRRKEQAPSAVFPCVLKMIPGAIFSRRDPIIFGADVVEGALRVGTPICVVQFDATTKKRDVVNLGVVTGIENNHKPVEIVKKGMAGAGVAVKIECPPSDTPKLYGRHFTDKDMFYSCITRRSINVLKESFRNDLSKDEWALVVKLKKILDIV